MLKSLLSLLLSRFYSKQESELVGHQAMPSTDNVALTPTTTSIDVWGAVYNGVAPTDGFACIRFTADTVTCIASAQTQNVNVFTTPQVVGDILLCSCPIAKGQVFTLCARQAKNIECWFTKTIGGGYQALKNALLQGGVLCRLKHLCNSLQRNSLLARRNGWLNSLVQNSRPLILAHRPQEIGWNLSHRKQDTFALRPTLSKFLFKYLGFGRAVSPVKKATRVSIFTWKKGKPSRISYLLMLRAPSLLSTERRASAHNLTVGGASC